MMNKLIVQGNIPAPEFEEVSEYRNLYLNNKERASGAAHVTLEDARDFRGEGHGQTLKITRTKEGDFVFETVETF